MSSLQCGFKSSRHSRDAKMRLENGLNGWSLEKIDERSETHKIAGFIYEPIKTRGTTVKDENDHKSYKSLFQDRWMAEAERRRNTSTANKVRITWRIAAANDLLNRCIVGKFQCQAHQNPSQWIRRKMKLGLEWVETNDRPASPEIRRDWVWIRFLGLLMNLWSQKVFKEIGDIRGGFIEAEEEETSLKNHLGPAQTSITYSVDIINIEISANKAKENKCQCRITQWNRGQGSRSHETRVWRWRSDRENWGEEDNGNVSTIGGGEFRRGERKLFHWASNFREEDMSISDTTKYNQTKLEFGVNFKGCEEKAKELLMKMR
ncbi:hypothetical protein H5410_002037 [Solanum commersonii]|uniref:DUF4283 domain-containing protein n=1 Tax=Solanum commersonii TaxID=4109 RepID=A0A9J6B0T3_SOLCO|nr:hypothetical protein H5410_002037 [Solanum commersonii]